MDTDPQTDAPSMPKPSAILQQRLQAERAVAENSATDTDENMAMIGMLKNILRKHGADAFDPFNATDRAMLLFAQLELEEEENERISTGETEG